MTKSFKALKFEESLILIKNEEINRVNLK